MTDSNVTQGEPVTRTRAVAAAVLLVMLIPATPCGSSEGDDGLEAIIGTELTSGCSDSRFSERRDVAGVVGYALVACGSADQSAIKITNLTNAAVSYTHLRAHETVLDLVCRLLLEKKKQTLNSTPPYICTVIHCFP